MRLPRTLASAGLALVVAATGLALAPSAQATTKPAPRSLAAFLTSDGNTFDRNAHDYDIVTEAVLAVLAAKPSSPVKVLTDGAVPLTAFVPTDQAFSRLVRDLTGTRPKSEKATFETVAGLGIDTVETVLLYHVVPGVTIDAVTALTSNGAKLATAQGGTIGVHVCLVAIRLVDADTNDADPYVIGIDFNKGNPQIAHGINRVLRPIDL